MTSCSITLNMSIEFSKLLVPSVNSEAQIEMVKLAVSRKKNKIRCMLHGRYINAAVRIMRYNVHEAWAQDFGKGQRAVLRF